MSPCVARNCGWGVNAARQRLIGLSWASTAARDLQRAFCVRLISSRRLVSVVRGEAAHFAWCHGNARQFRRCPRLAEPAPARACRAAQVWPGEMILPTEKAPVLPGPSLCCAPCHRWIGTVLTFFGAISIRSLGLDLRADHKTDAFALAGCRRPNRAGQIDGAAVFFHGRGCHFIWVRPDRLGRLAAESPAGSPSVPP